MMNQQRSLYIKEKVEPLPGIFFCLLLALPAWFLGKQFPMIGGPVFGILFGMILSTLFPQASAVKGISFTTKKILQYAIILIGFEMNLMTILIVGKQSLMVMLFTLSAAFLSAFALGKILKLPGNVTTLIGVGTSICGGSAIAATAPVIQAEDKDVAQAISTIFLFNILAVFLFPFLGHLMGMSDQGFGMWAGTAINDTSSVVAAGSAWSAASGTNEALEFATIVKLTRTLMIIPITLCLALYQVNKKRAQEGNFSLRRIFPWFILGFLAAAMIHTFLPLPELWASRLAMTGKFMIVMAMSAIGLNTQLKRLIKSGWKPILLGVGCWFSVATVSLLVQKLMGTL